MKVNYTKKVGYNSFKTSSTKSVTLFLKTLIGLLVLLFSFNIFGQAAKCITTLKVEKDRNTNSTGPEGTSYKMILSNNGSTNATYLLSALNISSGCTNNDDSNSSENVNLIASFTDANSNSEISLNPGQTKNFIVTINVPTGTAVNKWNCTKITATPSTCPNYNVSIILHTLVSDPSQE